MTTPPTPPSPEGEPAPYGFGAPPPELGAEPYTPASAPPPAPYVPPPSPPPYPPPYGPPVPPTSQKAVWAFVCGLLGIGMCCFPVGVVGLVLGLVAKREVNDSRGRLGGAGFAQAGFVLGLISVVLSVLYLAFTVTTTFLPLFFV
ncbi:DUF4190 domain-containing protein [Mumia sp. DW29H23]|uniref:DUF4190 domain-containing protein n=1 Tax=Mumia sp. DW29H23 TaxID=3421241 RepID=UPI003D68DAAD